MNSTTAEISQTELSKIAYEGLAYDQRDLAAIMRATYEILIDFVTSNSFKRLMLELGDLPAERRPSFVEDVLLDADELKARGIDPPSGVLIQRSAFGDRRPTLFVVKKFLPEKYMDVWQNVNLTFDNEYLDEEISRDPAVAWRKPLTPADQAQAMARNDDLESI